MHSEQSIDFEESLQSIYARAAGAIADTRAMTATTTLLMRDWVRLHDEARRRQDESVARTSALAIESSLPRFGASERARRTFMRELGMRVRERRLALGKHQVHLARAAGTSQAAISRLEQGSAVHMPAIQVLNVVRMLGLDEYDISFPVTTIADGTGDAELFDRFTAAFGRVPSASRKFLVRVVEELVDDGWRTATPVARPALRTLRVDAGAVVRLAANGGAYPEKETGSPQRREDMPVRRCAQHDSNMRPSDS